MIKVYIADLTGLENEYDEKLNMLHRSRADKLNSYKMSADKVRSLGAGLLLEKGLEDFLRSVDDMCLVKAVSKETQSSKMNCRGRFTLPKDAEGRYIIEYGYGPQGKPYFKDYPDIHFSLSHSGKMAVLALADSEVGIDVQEFRGFQEKVAKRFYHEEEYKMLEAVSEAEAKEMLFYKIWTCKEGYIKYTGEGMGQDLRSFYYDAKREKVCNEEAELANCQEIPLNTDNYFCSLVFHQNVKKIDKIIKLSL